MGDLINLLHNPALYWAVAIYFVFMAATDALPEPCETSSTGYKFVFRFCHALSGNLKRAAVQFHVPGVQADK